MIPWPLNIHWICNFFLPPTPSQPAYRKYRPFHLACFWGKNIFLLWAQRLASSTCAEDSQRTQKFSLFSGFLKQLPNPEFGFCACITRLPAFVSAGAETDDARFVDLVYPTLLTSYAVLVSWVGNGELKDFIMNNGFCMMKTGGGKEQMYWYIQKKNKKDKNRMAHFGLLLWPHPRFFLSQDKKIALLEQAV